MKWGDAADFYLKNRKEVEAVIQIKEIAEKDILDGCKRNLMEAIEHALRPPWRGMRDDAWVDDDGALVWWSDAGLYDWDKGLGFWFGIPNFEFEALKNPEDIYVDLVFDQGEGRQQPEGIEEALRQAASIAVRGKHGIRFEVKKPEGSLVWQPIGDILNIDCLGDFESILPEIVQRVRTFTEIFAPHLPRLG